MPRRTRKQRTRKQRGGSMVRDERLSASTRRADLAITTNQRGGSNNEKATLENVLGVSSAIGYEANTLIPGLGLSRRSRSNYLTNLAREKAIRYNQKILFQLWLSPRETIQEKLQKDPFLKKASINHGKKVLLKFDDEIESIENQISYQRYELMYGRDAPYIARNDLQYFQGKLEEVERKRAFFIEFLEKEAPDVLRDYEMNPYNNNNNYYQQNNNNQNNNNYGNAMRALYGNENNNI